jgi:hypothetical protein
MGAAEKSPAGLSIVIQEQEHTALTADNSISRFDPRGRLVVRNTSRKFAVWDAELELNRPNRTTLGTDALEIGRLEPLAEWEKEFIVKEIGTPMILFTEVVDTYHERVGVNDALVFEYSMPVEFTLTLRNHSGSEIQDIIVTKTIPPIFKKIQIQQTQIGKVDYDSKEGKVVWTIKQLPPDRIAIQRFRATVMVEDTQPQPSGRVHVTYRIPNTIRSQLVPKLHGATQSEVSVEKEEHPMRVGTWRCKASLSNSSEFPIRIERVQVIMTKPENELLYEGHPNLRLEPDEVWGHEFEVTEEQPEFDVITLSTVEAPIVQEILGTIEKEEKVLPVLRIEGNKKAEPLELLAWEPAPIAVTLQAKNTGSVNCDEITFQDNIPPGFDPPDETQIRVRVGDRPITRSMEVKISPKSRDLKVPHSLNIRIHDLAEKHEAVKPGETVTANYIMIARAPKPNHEHSLPLTVEANTFPPGPVASVKIPETTVPVIRVRSVIRKLRKTRTVTPGEKAGELLVTVTFVNDGETSLQEPELQDLIPPNFEYVRVPEGSTEPSLQETINGTILSWSLPSMMSREKFVVKYIYQPKT